VVEAPQRRRLDTKFEDALAFGFNHNFTLEAMDAAYQRARAEMVKFIEANRKEPSTSASDCARSRAASYE
jgi:hypothetical protein